MEEIWKDVIGYEGLYQVSNFGKVKSLGNDKTCKEKILKHGVDSKGYCHIGLFKRGKRKCITIHQLVAIAFLNHTPCGVKTVVDHINNNKSDNRLENLQLITNRENCSKDVKNKSSKYTGVSWCKSSKKWKSMININGKLKYLGVFKCELAASVAYQNKLKQIL